MKVAFDLDGVLADSLHRAKYAPDWNLFYEKIPDDLPILETVELVRLLSSFHEVVFITSRPLKTMDKSLKWLMDHVSVPKYDIFMREDGNSESNASLKTRICKGIKPDLVFEDDEEVAQALFNEGFKVMLFLRNKEFTERSKSTEEWAQKGWSE